MSRYLKIIDQAVRPIAFLWELRQDIRQQRWRLLALSLLTVGISMQFLITPQLTRMIIDDAYPSRNLRLFFLICGGMIGLNLLSSVFQALQDYLTTYVNAMVSVKVRLRIFQALNRLPLSYVEGQKSGMLLERSSYDADVTANILASVTTGLASLILTTVMALILMLKINLLVTLLVFLCVPFYYLFNTILATKMRSWEGQMRSKTDQVTSLMTEAVQGIPTAKYFDANKWLCATYAHLLREKLTITFGMWRTQLIYGRLAWAISYGWGIFLTCGGWYLVFCDRLLLGEAVALGMYVPLLLRPAEEAVRMYRSLMSSSVSAQRINEVIVESKKINAKRQSIRLDRLREISLRNITFAYPKGTPCLRNVSLEFAAGDTVVVLGSTGSGKTTLLRLLAGVYDKYDGDILVNQIDCRQFNGNEYQSKVGMVLPENFFFSGSLWENVQLAGSHVTQNQVEGFTRILGLDSWIRSLPQGFRTQLGVNGTNG
jgi:ABC-type bacteriocin/lantibiotic exporter with double-glycine peptidase domain